MAQGIWQFYQTHKDTINNLFSGVLGAFLLAAIVWIGSFIWWRFKEWRQHRIPVDTSPFKIIPRNSNLLPIIYGEEKLDDPLADSRLKYQRRIAEGDIQRELQNLLEEGRWLIILAPTGLGKTREAAELAQNYNRNGWTVLLLKSGEWLDKPTRKQFQAINATHKLLFFLDDLNPKMRFSQKDEVSPKAEKSPLEPRIIPLQERLLRTLEAYEDYFRPDEVRVIATARNERESPYPGQPSEWDKLQWEKYPQLWDKFERFDLPEPEDGAIVELLQDTVPETKLKAKETEYPDIASQNDCTFRNVQENLLRLRTAKLPLTANNYIPTLRGNWEKRYDNAIKRYPLARYIYDGVDLLRQFNVSLEGFIVLSTARLLIQERGWKRWWYGWRMGRVLRYLRETERLLNPRDGQIEAKGRSVEATEYIRPLSRLIWRLADRDPMGMLESLAGFTDKLYQLKRYKQALIGFNKLLRFDDKIPDFWFYCATTLYYLERNEEAIASYDRALEFKPDKDEAWNNRGVALFNLGRNEEALASFDRVLEFKPDYVDAWYNKACSYALQENINLAIENLQQAIALDPTNRDMAKTDSDFDKIRSDVRFQRLLEENGQ